jgi:hypothetical protein
MEEDIINLNPAQLDKIFEETDGEDDTVLAHFNDKDGWTFNIWLDGVDPALEETTKGKVQPFFLLEDMGGTDKKNPEGMLQALLTPINYDGDNLALQI